MAIYQAPNVTTQGYTPPGNAHGIAGLQCLHAKAYASAGLALNDTIQFGYIPPNAIVVGAVLQADSQLDSNGAPTLTFDLGVTGTTQLWKAAVSTVGRATGVTADNTLATTGMIYKNTSGAKQLVIATAHAAAATGAAGSLEVLITYYVEDAVGSPA